MGRYLGPKEKIERRLGERIGMKGERSSSPKSASVRRPYPPGQHGPTRKMRKLSEFGTQLRIKQKIRMQYRLLEKPLRKLVQAALANRKESPFVQLVRSLESRLDNIVFRMGLAQSRDQSRQIVGHGHILVNGKRAKTPSCVVRVGDEIEIAKRSLNLPLFQTFIPRWFAEAESPDWLSVDRANMKATMQALPDMESSGIQPADLQAIIEYYSR